jgi:hypothetical protein
MTRGDEVMDMRKFSGATFLKLDDVRDGPIQKRIAGVVMGKYGKPDLIFEDASRLSVNTTNTRILINEYGWDSEDWVGHLLELYEGEGEFDGKTQDMLAVKTLSKADPGEAAEPVKKKPSKPRDDMDDELPY